MGTPKTLLITLVLVAVAMAGCTDAGDPQADSVVMPGPTESSSTETQTDTASPAAESEAPGSDPEDENSTADPVEPVNHAPVADLTADVTTGTVPFDVSFDFDATDEDGDDLTWTLDADGDGEDELTGDSLPLNFTYTFDAPGTYTAVFVVTDGLEAVNKTVEIVAVEKKADEFSWSCTVDVPAVQFGISGLPVNYGGCELGTFGKAGVFVGQEADLLPRRVRDRGVHARHDHPRDSGSGDPLPGRDDLRRPL